MKLLKAKWNHEKRYHSNVSNIDTQKKNGNLKGQNLHSKYHTYLAKN